MEGGQPSIFILGPGSARRPRDLRQGGPVARLKIFPQARLLRPGKPAGFPCNQFYGWGYARAQSPTRIRPFPARKGRNGLHSQAGSMNRRFRATWATARRYGGRPASSSSWVCFARGARGFDQRAGLSPDSKSFPQARLRPEIAAAILAIGPPFLAWGWWDSAPGPKSRFRPEGTGWRSIPRRAP